MEEEKAGFAAWMTLLRVHQKIQQRVTNLLAGYGLSLAQFDVLVKLLHQEGVTQQQLADRLLVTKGNVTGLIDRLEQQSLVVRQPDPEDRRSNLLYLTDAGRSLMREVLPPHKAQIVKLMDSISGSEQQQLFVLLQQLELNLPDK